MIISIGTDLTIISRIAGTLADHGRRFEIRCFADQERAYIDQKYAQNDLSRAGAYARRWAAKEACAKALGSGIRDDVFLKDIVVVNDAAGKPSLDLRGGAAEKLASITPAGKTAQLNLSLSDDGDMAIAFVIISAV